MRRILESIKNALPAPVSLILAASSAFLLVLAFPDFEYFYFAWFALVPLFRAVAREKGSWQSSFLTGWVSGTVFFFTSCWWLTYAPITYAGMPWLLTYFLLLCASIAVGFFPGVFAGVLSVSLRRFGDKGIFLIPFIWVFSEFLRYWLTGNNWNAIGYSQAFFPGFNFLGRYGGVLGVSFLVAAINAALYYAAFAGGEEIRKRIAAAAAVLAMTGVPIMLAPRPTSELPTPETSTARIIAVQPNVPMNGLTWEKYQRLLQRHFQLAESRLTAGQPETGKDQSQKPGAPKTVIVFPESPMIFQYGRDPELQETLRGFARRNNSSVLFNSAEETQDGRRNLNSAVMIDENGDKIGQYDKIHLLPFGEFMPLPESLAAAFPAFVGNFKHGNEYDLLPFGEAKAGVMICFESHFGDLSREYALRGADFLVEMTNDGYLGKTPVLRQHLASAVYRAIETGRPVVRVTNVGVTAYITQTGRILDEAEVYTEATRVWTVPKMLSGETLYVRLGDWLAWLCSAVSVMVVLIIIYRRNADAQKKDL